MRVCVDVADVSPFVFTKITIDCGHRDSSLSFLQQLVFLHTLPSPTVVSASSDFLQSHCEMEDALRHSQNLVEHKI